MELQHINLYPHLSAGMLIKKPPSVGEAEADLFASVGANPPAALQASEKDQTLNDLNPGGEIAQAENPPGAPMFLPARQVLSPQTAFLTNTMLRDVIRQGTGRRARQLGRNDLAGKTGTTNDQQDAWFSGFTSQTVTITWVGFDNPRPLGEKETGARAALPMWIAYMREALRGEPESPLVQPPGMVNVRIDAASGLLAGPQSSETLFEYFPADQVPEEKPVRSGAPAGTEESSGDITEQLF